MPSRKQDKIPVIDFSAANLKPGTDYWVSACDNVRQVLEEYGCFEALYDEVSLELHNAVFDSLVHLFTLPVQTKARNISDKPYHGYFGQNPFMPLNESMGIEDPQILNRTQAFTNLMWPSGNESFWYSPGAALLQLKSDELAVFFWFSLSPNSSYNFLSESICSYSRIVSQLDGLVKAMAFESYGVRKYLDSHINSTAYLLRVIKYSVPKERESDIGAVSHTDKSFISILHQNDVKGLEIKTRDDKWIGFEPLPSSFVVMAGEAFTAWSNGRIYSPQHKVIMRGDRARYSLALFSFNNGTIQTPEELFDDEHPLQFKPFDHLKFLRFYSTDEGQKYPSTINAYCGISL